MLSNKFLVFALSVFYSIYSDQLLATDQLLMHNTVQWWFLKWYFDYSFGYGDMVFSCAMEEKGWNYFLLCRKIS